MTPISHIPVMKEQVMQYLVSDPTGIYIDGTLGAGGHSLGILEKLNSSGLLIGVDSDENVLQPTHIQLSVYSRNQYSLHHSNFCDFPKILENLGINQVTGILLDLGLSSMELSTASRGFSFQIDGPLDMRFDFSHSLTAEILLNNSSESELSEIIHSYGEEKYHKKIARSIVSFSKRNKMKTTFDLKEAVEYTISGRFLNKSLARVFQSIRIAVNKELDILRDTLVKTSDYLTSGGRLVVISYHSLEDRIVKQFFRNSTKTCICPSDFPVCKCSVSPTYRVITKKPVIPDVNEINQNPRARSAKLRAAERK